MARQDLWQRYLTYLSVDESVRLTVDISRMRFPETFFGDMEGPIRAAFCKMEGLERGEIANPDEGRMVGHYWLRDPARAPTAEIRLAIEDAVRQVKRFAGDVHAGRIAPQRGGRFQNLLVIGIGGSALGPQFVSAALGTAADRMRIFFFDNTDPDGIDRTLAAIGDGLARTLTIVISKSGMTPETRNGMLEARHTYQLAGLSFPAHAVAVTGVEESALRKTAQAEGWLEVFPMWDWVGGRTSETSPVGLLPAALQGIDIDGLLAGAREMDAVTRVADPRRNPAALLALMWYHAGGGRGSKDMVILPYKDRLDLFSRYLQQLVMESLGKERDLEGNVVNQGIAVYGNKGSTDQHAYVQQLREGVNNFFVTFIEVLRDRGGESIEVEEGATSGDYLSGLLQGTRRALYENGRDSITITIDEVSARSVGRLIALYERAVGLYGFLINVNAYHQPGVEAGKRAAGEVLSLQRRVVDHLRARPGQALGVEEIAAGIGYPDDVETIYLVLRHLAANPDRGIAARDGPHPRTVRYSAV